MGPSSELTLKTGMQEKSSFIHASRNKDETGTFGNRYCRCGNVQNDKIVLLPNKTLKHTNAKHPLESFVY